MKIGIVGTGNIGSQVGNLLLAAGHDVVWGSRSPREAEDIVSIRAAVEYADAVLIAVPFGAWPELATELGAAFEGKIVIDAGNPNPGRDGAFAVDALNDPGGSGRPVANLLPGARLVRSFSIIEAGMMGREAHREGERLGLSVAGDDTGANLIVAGLVSDAGFTPVITGDLATAKRFDNGTDVFGGGLTGPQIRLALGLGEPSP